MQLSIRCTSAPWENETTDEDRAIDLAYSLSEEYSCDVQLVYTSTGTIHSVVSNYWSNKMTQTIYVKFVYENSVSEEIPIHTQLDLSKNSNRTRLLNLDC